MFFKTSLFESSSLVVTKVVNSVWFVFVFQMHFTLINSTKPNLFINATLLVLLYIAKIAYCSSRVIFTVMRLYSLYLFGFD
jgi:hypothetical protein